MAVDSTITVKTIRRGCKWCPIMMMKSAKLEALSIYSVFDLALLSLSLSCCLLNHTLKRILMIADTLRHSDLFHIFQLTWILLVSLLPSFYNLGSNHLLCFVMSQDYVRYTNFCSTVSVHCSKDLWKCDIWVFVPKNKMWSFDISTLPPKSLCPFLNKRSNIFLILFQGDLIHTTIASDEDGCLNQCANVDGCHWYSFDRNFDSFDRGTCLCMRNCPSLNEMFEFVSGQVECQVKIPYCKKVFFFF